MNCSVFRSVYGMVANVHNGYPLLTLLRFDDFENAYPPPRLLLSFAVGLIPLLNVLLIGIVRFAARWLRSARGEHAENSRSPAGFTFFAIYFLGVSLIACMFMPAVIATYMVVVESSLERASDAFAHFCARFGDTLPFFVIECMILFVFISGPVLVTSWIGGVLGRRCVATLPRGRLRLMIGLVSLGFVSAALAIAFVPFEFAGTQNVDLDFQIVDRRSHQPIGGAFLRISNPFDPDWPDSRALTGPDGRAD